MIDEADNFWRTHLSATDRPLIHFVPTTLLDLNTVEKVVGEIGFALFVIDAGKIATEDAVASECAVMDAFAASMNLPSYFGRNWDALLDLTRDLSWTKANGYVLIMSNGDNLSSLPGRIFSTLTDVVEATVRDWRDERGEYGERTGPVPFHVIFSGGEVLKEALLSELKESLCEHIANCSINIFPMPVRLRKTAPYRDAERLIKAGADAEMVLSFLREHNTNQRDSTYMLAGLLGKTLSEARTLTDNSQTWSDQRGSDEIRRNATREALRDFGCEDS